MNPYFKYYLLYQGKFYRAFNLTLNKQGVLVIERKYPRKDSHLSRKRGIKYIASKDKFTPTWAEDLEYVGCSPLPLRQLAPCGKEEADPARTIILQDKQESINVHLFVIKQGRQQGFKDYNTDLLGKKVSSFLEKEVYPNVGVIVTC